MLVQYKADLIIIPLKINLFSTLYRVAIKLHITRSLKGLLILYWINLVSQNQLYNLIIIHYSILGEDRWLCTLLLQQGYRVDYAAASDAYTYAPEGFGEFFNQRRRWMPSTIANIMDLLADAKNTVSINNNISWLYMIYQGQ